MMKPRDPRRGGAAQKGVPRVGDLRGRLVTEAGNCHVGHGSIGLGFQVWHHVQ